MKRTINVKHHKRKTKKGYVPVRKHTKKVTKTKQKRVVPSKTPKVQRKNYSYFLTTPSEEMQALFEDPSVLERGGYRVSPEESAAAREVAVAERIEGEQAAAKKIRQDFRISRGEEISDEDKEILRTQLRESGFEKIPRTEDNPIGFDVPEPETVFDEEPKKSKKSKKKSKKKSDAGPKVEVYDKQPYWED